jgi:hypothetical protein
MKSSFPVSTYSSAAQVIESLESRTMLSGGGGGGGGGGGAVTPPANEVIAYSNFGLTDPPPASIGWGVVGQQTAGFFNYVGEQFAPTITGAVSTIRIPLHQFDTGGNGGFTVNLFTDSPAARDTLGTKIGSFRGQAIRTGSTSTAIPTLSVSNGPTLQAGAEYWIEVEPSSQSREMWDINPTGVAGNLYEIDSNVGAYYTPDQQQGAFEIRVTQAAVAAPVALTLFSTTPIIGATKSLLAGSVTSVLA